MTHGQRDSEGHAHIVRRVEVRPLFSRLLLAAAVGGGTAVAACAGGAGCGSSSSDSPSGKTDGGEDASADGTNPIGPGVVSGGGGEGGDFDAYAVCGSWTVPAPSACSDAGAETDASDDASTDAGFAFTCATDPSLMECEALCADGNPQHGSAGNCRMEQGNSGPVYQCAPGCASAGRRHDAYAPTVFVSASAGAYFAELARLEEASVHAFERLARELMAHGAQRAVAAAYDAAVRDLGGELFVELPKEVRAELGLPQSAYARVLFNGMVAGLAA